MLITTTIPKMLTTHSGVLLFGEYMLYKFWKPTTAIKKKVPSLKICIVIAHICAKLVQKLYTKFHTCLRTFIVRNNTVGQMPL